MRLHNCKLQSRILAHAEHFAITQSDQVERAAEINLFVGHTIGHTRYWGHTFDSHILGSRAQLIDPFCNIVNNEIVY